MLKFPQLEMRTKPHSTYPVPLPLYRSQSRRGLARSSHSDNERPGYLVAISRGSRSRQRGGFVQGQSILDQAGPVETGERSNRQNESGPCPSQSRDNHLKFVQWPLWIPPANLSPFPKNRGDTGTPSAWDRPQTRKQQNRYPRVR
jgi:hypothetical protein